MTNESLQSNATRTLVLAIGTWGVVAAGIAGSGVFGRPGVGAAIAIALALAAIAFGAYAADDELREAARTSSRPRLLGWALAFDLATVMLLAIGAPAMVPLFTAPLAIAFHAVVFVARPARRIRISAPARSPARSPAGT